MIELSNNKTITTANLLARAIEKHINTNITFNISAKPWLDELKFHLDNVKPDGSYPKYSISKLKFLIRHLGHKYLIE